MRWWGSKPQSETTQTLDSATFLTITLLSSPSAPQFLLPFSGLFIRFLPPPGPIPYHPKSSTRRRCFSISLHPLLPPIFPGCESTVHLDGAPACRPPPLVYTFFPFWAAQGVPHASLCMTSLVRLPPLFRPQPAQSCPCCPHGSPVYGVPSSLFLTHHMHARSPPPAGLNRLPSPLPFLGGGVMFFVPLSPVHPPCPPCVPRCLLVLYEV